MNDHISSGLLDGIKKNEPLAVVVGMIMVVLECLQSARCCRPESVWRIRPFGDFRLRMEQDWDSPNGGGTMRDDRLKWNLNYVALPVGMTDVSGIGLLGQLAFEQDYPRWGYTLASS